MSGVHSRIPGGVPGARGSWVVKSVSETHAVNRILGNAVDLQRWCDADNFVNCRDEIVAVMKLWARRSIGFDLCGPPDGHWVTRAAEVRGQKLRPLVRGAARPRPPYVVLVVGLGRAKRVESAEFIERLDVLLHGGGDAVLRQQFTDGAVLSLR